MKIAVFGTGEVGRTIAGRLAELGHEVTIGTRDPGSTAARDDYVELPGVPLATYRDAATAAELLVNGTSGHGTLPALAAAGAEAMAGKVLIDISNPLDFSNGFPPSLFVKDTDSLGERVQAAYPDTFVVKALNTLAAELMAYPGRLAGGDHSVFVAGNDADAKKTATTLLESFGHTDVIDLGDITASRGTELVLPIWLRLMGAFNTATFNFKVIR